MTVTAVEVMAQLSTRDMRQQAARIARALQVTCVGVGVWVRASTRDSDRKTETEAKTEAKAEIARERERERNGEREREYVWWIGMRWACHH
jgi:hypothetical protein